MTASRVLFAYAWDGSFIFFKITFRLVNTHSKTPVNAVWANYIIRIVLFFLVFNTGALNAIFSVSATAAYIAFITPVIIIVFYNRKNFQTGPCDFRKVFIVFWSLAISFVILMISILSFLETTGENWVAANINRTSLIYFGPPTMFALLSEVRTC